MQALYKCEREGKNLEMNYCLFFASEIDCLSNFLYCYSYKENLTSHKYKKKNLIVWFQL